jgi:adenosylhomocysteine nucleosidase
VRFRFFAITSTVNYLVVLRRVAPEHSFPDTSCSVNQDARTDCEVIPLSIHSQVPLIVVAMPSEMRHALEAVENAERTELGPWVRWSAKLDGWPVNLLLSGIGMVNAGASLARSLCDLSPSVVINYGCAGAHRPEMHPGDVVIGTRYVHHRSVTVLPNGEEKYGGTPVTPENSSNFIDGFDADAQLLARVRAAALDWSPDPWPGLEDNPAPVVHAGTLTSADAWTQATDIIERINAEHGTFCEDMEAAALAQIAWMHEIPFLAVKDISNNEFHFKTEHGATGGPTLQTVMDEVGRRAFELIRRALVH